MKACVVFLLLATTARAEDAIRFYPPASITLPYSIYFPGTTTSAIDITYVGTTISSIEGNGTNRFAINADYTLQLAAKAGIYEWETNLAANYFTGYKWASAIMKPIIFNTTNTTGFTFPLGAQGYSTANIQNWMTLNDYVVSAVTSDGGFVAPSVRLGTVTPIVTAPTITGVTQGGTAGAATYCYRMTAVHADSTSSFASPEVCTNTGNATLSGTNYNIIAWGAVAGAASYTIYRTSGGTSQGAILEGSTITSLFDVGDGASTVRTAPPAAADDTLASGLGTPANGTIKYCSDCAAESNPCSGSSTGAIAKRLNGAWDCR